MKSFFSHQKLLSVKLLVLHLLSVLAFICGYSAHAETVTEESAAEAITGVDDVVQIKALPLEELRIFTQIYSNIRSAYIEEIDDATLLEYAIKGMLSELDPHSAYLDASTFDDLQIQTTGEFGGLGIEVGMEDGFVKVVSPIDDTPAMRAGIEAGDLIIKLDGKTVKGLSLSEAIDKMRGEKGSEIVVTVVREGVDAPFDVSITRDAIKVRSVRSGVKDEYYGYIRVATFQVNTGNDVAEAYQKLIEASPELRGIVLDLRNNPGGVLQAAVDVVDTFLDDGMVVYTEGRRRDAEKKYFANKGDISNGLPLIVLINDGSASASEIVAGALQDHRRALVMGTRSFGKGSVQSVIPVTEDRGVKLTTARYFTPSGRSIQAQGIEPDLVVERVRVTAVQPRAGITEADLSGHLANGNGGNESDSKSRNSADTEQYNKDSQLYEALTLLKGLSMFKNSDRSFPTLSANNKEHNETTEAVKTETEAQ